MANRVTQVAPEVVITPTDSKARVSQVAPEIVITPSDAQARISQLAVEVLIKQPITVTASIGGQIEILAKASKTTTPNEESKQNTLTEPRIIPFEAKGRILVGNPTTHEFYGKVSHSVLTPQNSWKALVKSLSAAPTEYIQRMMQAARPKQESLGPASPVTSNSAISFSVTEGDPDPASQSINVSNAGGGSLAFTASSDSAWLTVSPTSGTAPATLSISVAQSGLQPGTYVGRITVTGPSGTSTTAVTFNISGPSFLFLNDTSGQTWKVGIDDFGELTQGEQVPTETSSPSTINGPSTSWLIGISTLGRVNVTSQTFGTHQTYIQMESPGGIIFWVQVRDDGELYAVAQLGSPGTGVGSPPVGAGAGGTGTYVVSRYAAMARVEYPLIPPQPSSWEVNEATIAFPKFHVLLPPDTRDIFGILVQDARTKINGPLSGTSDGSAGDTIVVVSDTTTDTRGVVVVGQDFKGNYVEERLRLNGTTPVTTKKKFAYILWVDSLYGTVLNEVPTPIPDGQAQIFTVSKNAIPGSLQVSLDSNPQTTGVDYNPTGKIIAEINPPPNGSQLLVSYLYVESPTATLTISQTNGGAVLGQIQPGALEWLSNPILYRYEDLSLGSDDADPALYFTLANTPNIAGGTPAIPIVASTAAIPGLNFDKQSAGITVNGATEVGNIVTLKFLEPLQKAYPGAIVNVQGVGGGTPNQPTWNQNPGGTTGPDGSITWTNRGPIVLRTPSTFYSNATTGGTIANPCIVYDPVTKTCYIQSNSNPGLRESGPSATITFNPAPGAHTDDGDVVWISVGGTGIPGVWQAGTSYPTIGTVSNNDAGSSIAEPFGLQNGLPTGTTIWWQVSSGGVSGATPAVIPGFNGNFTILSVDTPGAALQITYRSSVAGLAQNGGGTANLYLGSVYPVDAFTVPTNLLVTINGADSAAWNGNYQVLQPYGGQTIEPGGFLDIILAPNQFSTLGLSGGGTIQAAIAPGDVTYLEHTIYVYFYNLLDELSPPYEIDYVPGSGLNSSGSAPTVATNYDIVFNLTGLPNSGEEFLVMTFDRAVTWPADLVGSTGSALHPASGANIVFVINKGGAPVGSVIFNGVVASFQSSGQQVMWGIGEQMTITCPNPADPTLADLAITFKGSTTE